MLRRSFLHFSKTHHHHQNRPVLVMDVAGIQKVVHEGLTIAREMNLTFKTICFDAHHPRQALTSSVVLPFSESNLRPGNTLSGPTMFALADAALYSISLAVTGEPLTVTQNININFLEKPRAHSALVAEARALRMSKRLHSMEVDIYSVQSEVAEMALKWELEPDQTLMHALQSRRGCDDDDVQPVLVSHATGSYSVPVKRK